MVLPNLRVSFVETLSIIAMIDDATLNECILCNSHLDINLITTQVTITANNTQPCVRFEAVTDSLGLEGVENLTLTLSGPPNVQLTHSTADIFIEDFGGK